MKRAIAAVLVLAFLLSSKVLNAQPSRVEKGSFSSNALGLTKNYYVYLPSDYDNSTERYPVAYFLRGHEFEWVDPAAPGRSGGRTLKDVADDLYSNGQIGKMIIVCPSTASEDYGSFVHSCGVNMLNLSLRTTAGIGTGQFENYFIQDLMPHIDATLRTIADREHRAIDGFSLGGYNSTMLSLRHPELFISVGSYDGTIMWYDLDDPRIPGANADDPNWNDGYFDPVFDRPRNVPYMLQHSASNILRAAEANQLEDIRAGRFHISMTPSDNVGNHSNNVQLISIFAEKGIRNSFENPSLAPNAVHNFGFADQHAAISLIRHWQAFAGNKLNAPLAFDFGVVGVGESDTLASLLFNYSQTPLTIFSVTFSNSDYTTMTNLPSTLPGRFDTLGFNVVFSPSADGFSTDTLTIASNDSANALTRIALRGRGLLIVKAQAGVTYTVGGASSRLFTVDRTTGAATLIGPTNTTFVNGLAIHPISKELYATVPSRAGTALYRVSSQSGGALLETTLFVSGIRGIAFQPDGTLFGVTVDGRLYEIKPLTGEATQIGSTSGIRYSGLSFNPFTRKLYASHLTQDRIYTINSNTGQVTLVGSTQFGGSYAIAFGPDGGLYGITRTNNFISIDSTTGAGTLIGPMATPGMSALAMRTDSILVSVDDKYNPNLAEAYHLDQNYPNPFNPSTKIRFALPTESNVRLAVYDVLGREVVTLLHEVRAAGEHAVEWNGTNTRGNNVGSGIFLYRLEVKMIDKKETFTSMRKMVLLR